MNREKAVFVVAGIKSDAKRHDQSLWTNINATPGYEYRDGTVYPGHGTPKIKETEDQVINCGTTACLAGHTAFIFAPVGTRFYREALRLPGEPAVSYEDYAHEELELDQKEVVYLFSGDRTLNEIEEYVVATDERQSEILDDLYDEDNY